MIEQLLFHGIRDAAKAATCLAGYDRTRDPEGSGPSFTGFFLPKGFAPDLRLERCGADLWNANRAMSVHNDQSCQRWNWGGDLDADSRSAHSPYYASTLPKRLALGWLFSQANWRGPRPRHIFN
jgi:hypothetical protein